MNRFDITCLDSRSSYALLWHRRILGTVLILILLLLSYVAYSAWQTHRHLAALRAHIGQVKSLVPLSPAALCSIPAQVQRDVALLRRDLSLSVSLAPYFGWLPYIGPTLEAGAKLVPAGEALLQSSVMLCEVIQNSEAFHIPFDETSPSEVLSAISTQISGHQSGRDV